MNEQKRSLTIGTWNLDNRVPSEKHRKIFDENPCDVWLLTELNPAWIGSDGKVEGYHCHVSERVKEPPHQHWAAILSKERIDPLDAPHPASCAAHIHGTVFCSSVLPWRTRKDYGVWKGEGVTERTQNTLAALTSAFSHQLLESELVWGGDWNHSFSGVESSGSKLGRIAIDNFIHELHLQVPTKGLKHQRSGLSIDHIAVPGCWKIQDAQQIPTKGLSDHDAYVTKVATK
jgi:hypothetical protein